MEKYLYDYDAKLAREMELLNSSGISHRNKELVLAFHKYNIMRDLSPARLVKYINSLKVVGRNIKKDFDLLGPKDYEEFIFGLKQAKKSTYTIASYKAVLKTFHKWINGGETYTDCVKWMKNFSSKQKKLPDDMLVQEDVKNLLAHALNPRDKAFIAVIWESGARVSEVGTLQSKDVVFDEFGCKIMVTGKTGMRRVRLVNSAADLLDWLNKHPDNDGQNSWVWVNIETNRLEQMGHRYIMKMLKQTAKRAGIKKPVNPHNFRHSRATYMAQFLTEAQMKEYFGWTQDSKMAAQYVHLSGKQVDDAILRMHGLVKEDKLEDTLKRMPCPRCKELNDTNNKHCGKCWLPLTQQGAIEAEEKKEKDQKAMVAVMKLMEVVGNDPDKLLKTIQTIQGVA